MKNYFKITSEIYHWIMRFKVFLKKDDKEFDEVIIANNKNEAIDIALINNPHSKILKAEWTFKS